MISEILKDKTKKAKEKIKVLGDAVLNGSITLDALLSFAEQAKDPEKASCMEAIEYATKLNPQIADENLLLFMSKMLTENAPRVKWESGKVIGNITALFPTKLDQVITNLLANTEHDGTVVRWAAAYALSELLKSKTVHNQQLLPAIEAICEREEDNGVKKKYLEAIKKIKNKTSMACQPERSSRNYLSFPNLTC